MAKRDKPFYLDRHIEIDNPDYPLTKKQAAFCRFYAESDSISESYTKAGYKSKSPCTQAYKLMQRANIKRRIKEEQERIAERYDITEEKIIKGLYNKAFPENQGQVKVNENVQIKALELLGRYKAMFTDKQVLTGDKGLNIEINRPESRLKLNKSTKTA